ncbi:hypothetical protein MVLG_02487 [Microbotryum lychnidis-dioicae p1A1 Lamole]|uniref:Mediator of RNA polymerase II transcription subunit 19 n=1 Tax=Microbotryum lychnidis-dioicae (strain p1A1 Lamole / MvSl-1064) TaxID=683840 RepID=U5H5B2_USTV1|nr:hypothetical protein MVLG_02487 [Microbotryum lychnidis-dioicae p1A1 Lamole]|eukprot:KDE07267.1 hypothetical protein MVLG_02487 [Microbotryum lychnidis-dioicae p1A1 Lamole]
MEAGPSRPLGPIASTSTSTSTLSSTLNGGAELSTTAFATTTGRNLASVLIAPSNMKPSPLSGSRDLISLFHLEPLYDTHLRPFLPQDSTSTGSNNSTTSDPNTPNPVHSNGKGKQSLVVDPAPSRIGISFGGIKLGALGPGALNGSGNDGKQGNPTQQQQRQPKPEKEKTYLYLVADIPGRNAIRKDSYLKHLILNPDSPAVDLRALDEDVLRDAFTLKPGTIPGFDALVWENDTEVQGGPVNKKKKKKRLRESEVGGDGGGGGGGNVVTLTATGTPNLSGTTNTSEDDHRKKKKLKQG